MAAFRIFTKTPACRPQYRQRRAVCVQPVSFLLYKPEFKSTQVEYLNISSMGEMGGEGVGQKVLICTGYTCFKYDPFARKILQYLPFAEEGDKFFDFTYQILSDFNVLVRGEVEPDRFSENTFTYFSWSETLSEALIEIEESKIRNISFTINNLYEAKRDLTQDYESNLKSGIDLYSALAGPSYHEEEGSIFDYTIAIGTCTVCIATPRPGYKPQFLAPFDCFSAPVWGALIMTIASILVIQYVFQYMQYTSFRGLYTEQEALVFEDSPIALNICSYFLCGNPVRMLLGRLLTGKIIFCVFSFGALIICAVFQNGMVRLLSRQVKFADINTMEQLLEADLLIQSRDIEAHSSYSEQHAELRGLQDKFVTNFAYYKDVVNEHVSRDLAAR
ncbi:unnamed protein product [Bemisia tabaci]|uniref:Uncharacterized protein n=1 Tax=Bemisia tabaci TaxID=7038 RepID=A0A9P0AJM9_BEMTA|nr:unnamed protein product [Bemisia tabaci]